jgi:hypothetical protein
MRTTHGWIVLLFNAEGEVDSTYGPIERLESAAAWAEMKLAASPDLWAVQVKELKPL